MLIGVALLIGMATPVPVAPPPVPVAEARDLALARQVAAAMVPPGALGERMKTRFVAFGTAGMRPGSGPEASNPGAEIRLDAMDELMRNDPALEERVRITVGILGEEGLKAAAIIEPRYREAVASMLARRLTGAQLTDVLAFVGTPSGQAFAAQIIGVQEQPELVAVGRDLMALTMQRMVASRERVRAATAHLPPPKEPVRPVPRR